MLEPRPEISTAARLRLMYSVPWICSPGVVGRNRNPRNRSGRGRPQAGACAGEPWQRAAAVAICRPRGSAGGRTGLNLPNLITIARILLVPVIVWAIGSREMLIAFILFLAAGVSDAVDGFLAKRFGMATDFG